MGNMIPEAERQECVEAGLLTCKKHGKSILPHLRWGSKLVLFTTKQGRIPYFVLTDYMVGPSFLI